MRWGMPSAATSTLAGSIPPWTMKIRRVAATAPSRPSGGRGGTAGRRRGRWSSILEHAPSMPAADARTAPLTPGARRSSVRSSRRARSESPAMTRTLAILAPALPRVAGGGAKRRTSTALAIAGILEPRRRRSAARAPGRWLPSRPHWTPRGRRPQWLLDHEGSQCRASSCASPSVSSAAAWPTGRRTRSRGLPPQPGRRVRGALIAGYLLLRAGSSHASDVTFRSAP